LKKEKYLFRFQVTFRVLQLKLCVDSYMLCLMRVLLAQNIVLTVLFETNLKSEMLLDQVSTYSVCSLISLEYLFW
jgi:hypothetical protein